MHLLTSGRGILKQNRSQEVDPPRLPEGDALNREDIGHQPVPQEVSGDGCDDAQDGKNTNPENGDANSKGQLNHLIQQPVHFFLQSNVG